MKAIVYLYPNESKESLGSEDDVLFNGRPVPNTGGPLDNINGIGQTAPWVLDTSRDKSGFPYTDANGGWCSPGALLRPATKTDLQSLPLWRDAYKT